MTITVNFDSMPRTIYGSPGSTVNVRLLDQSTTTNGVINAWLWYTNNVQVFTTDSTGTDLVITNANLYFAVGDTVILSSNGTLPTGLNALSTAYYVILVTSSGIRLSLTSGGSAATYTVGSGSGQFQVGPGSNLQNPTLPLRNIGSITISVTLSVNDSGGTGYTTLTESAQIVIQTGTYAPPSQLSAYRNISLFVYERSTQASPKSTCVCRGPTAACNLFFQNLKMEGAITKAGQATFDIVNGGNATANEIDLFESDTVGTYKNVAVVAGYDVIWSGKITVATKELQSQPGAAKQRAIYHCQVDSDIYKLQDWNIVAPTTVTGQTPGQIVNNILIPNSGEPSYAGGYRGGCIDVSGLPLQMTLTNTDKYSLFNQLMATVDFDWRTRMDTKVFEYATFNGSNQITITSAGLTPSALIGQWLLFPTTNQGNLATISFCGGGGNNGGQAITVGDAIRQQSATAHGTVVSMNLTSGSWAAGTASGTMQIAQLDGIWVSGQYFDDTTISGGANSAYVTGVLQNPQTNVVGILAWGQITANTATTITAIITNAASVPLANNTCLIVNVPHLDFSSDLSEPTTVRQFTNNVDSVSFTGSDDKTNLFTAVCVKGATTIPVYSFNAPMGIPNQISVSISAKDAWDPVAGFFKNSSFVTHQTDGFIYSYATGSDTIILVGQNYALRSGDTIWIKGYMVNGAAIPQWPHTISVTPTTQTQADGTPTTTITVAAGNEPASNVVKYSIVIGAKTYVNNTANFPSSGNFPLNIGIESRNFNGAGIDPVYGPYLTMYGFGTNASVHYPGCMVSTQTYSQISPMPGSPVLVNGVITNTVTVSTNTTLPDLEVAACNMLIQGCQYYQKFSLVVSYYNYTCNRVRDGVQLMTPAFIREGAHISIIPYTGAAAIDTQVVIWDFDANLMQVTLTLGDYIHNVYNSIAKSLAPTQNALN